MVEGADSGVEIWALHGNEKRGLVLYRPPKVRPKNLTIGGRYFYG